MTTTSPEHRFERLHATYQRLSGRPIPWSRTNLHRWAHLAVEMEGFPVTIEEALPVVIERIKRLSRECAGFQHHLNFSRLTDPSIFQDHASAAFAESRKPEKSIKRVRYAGTERASIEVQQPEAKPIGDVLSSPAFQKFANLSDPKAFEEFVKQNKGAS